MGVKEYELPNGRKAVFEFDENGVGKITLEAMDLLMGMVNIDLVRCGECKYMRKYALRSDEPTGIWCHRWSVPRLVTDDDFCSYGERRSE